MFSQVIGQEEVKERLLRSVQEDRIAHALLIAGNEGTGKLALALAYAQYVHCTDRRLEDACGECPSCHKYQKLIHPDLHFVFPIGKADRTCDDYLREWRGEVTENRYLTREQWMAAVNAPNAPGIIYSKESDQITRKLNQKTFEADYKVMIIWLPERMHETTANKLLKILEEPFDKTLLLLVSNSPDEILPTITSRSQPVYVRPIAAEALTKGLVDRFHLNADDARCLAALASGSYARAKELISVTEESKAYFALFVSLMRNSYTRNIKAMKAWSEEVATLGRERQRNLLNYMLRLVRENFIFNLRERKLSYLNSFESEFAVKFSPYMNERNIYGFMNLFALAEQHIAQNVNAKMVFFDVAMRITILIKQ